MSRIVDGTEIPEEFDGIDDDIALGIMKDNGLIGDKQEETEVAEITTEVESTEKSTVETSESKTESKPTEDAALVKEQETKGDETDAADSDEANANKTVPYAAMKAERDRRKKEQRANEALQAELAQLRSQNANSMQVQQPVAQQQAAPTKTIEEQRQEYDDYIDGKALELFKKRNGNREPDDLDGKDNRTLARYAIEAENELIRESENQKKQAASTANQVQHTNQNYRQFVSGEKDKEEYDDLLLVVNEEFSKLPDDEKEIVGRAYNLCESGQCTPQDVHIVKKFWSDAAKKNVKPNETIPEKVTTVITPPKPAKTAEQKLEQIEKHTKADLVNGSHSVVDDEKSEAVRMMNTMNWADIPQKYKDILLNE